ncbi:hypothetical protein LB507_010998 [Fusarium sp. FIESC RH6]|nr:hypothetical protein LB507_010998 [Fusarium sp. FIESC RH6]
MRLINTATLRLEEFQSQIPEYAILSHTWGDDEVSFVDWQDNFAVAKTKAGFDKILSACEQAQADKIGYLWCDTNCIDKRSSSELSEAINSMFNWYRNSTICYAYLFDASPDETWSMNSRWFTRGWTLQELIAPREVIFFDKRWSKFGTRRSLSRKIFSITKIRPDHMGDGINKASISERMSWVSRRETSRPEDIAYCMLGIFDINMPLLYGEGGMKAFIRLQEEIIRVSNDQSIFCWHWDDEHVPDDWSSMLSPSHKTFETSGSYHQALGGDDSVSYTISNSGLSISLKLADVASVQNTWPDPDQRSDGPKSARLLALLNVQCSETGCRVAIPLRKPPLSKCFVRFQFPRCPAPMDNCDDVQPTTVCIVGPRDRRLLMSPPTSSSPDPHFQTLIVVNSTYTIESIAPIPSVHSYLNTIGLVHLAQPRFFGTVFALTFKINPPTESITIFCFVGVDDRDWSGSRYCAVLEACGPAIARSDIEKKVDAYKSRIKEIICRFTSSGQPFMNSSERDRLKTSGGKGISIHTGPWIPALAESKQSVTHITIPEIPSLEFRYMHDGNLMYLDYPNTKPQLPELRAFAR